MRVRIELMPWTGDHASDAGEEAGALLTTRVELDDDLLVDGSLKMRGVTTVDLLGLADQSRFGGSWVVLAVHFETDAYRLAFIERIGLDNLIRPHGDTIVQDPLYPVLVNITQLDVRVLDPVAV